MIVAGKWNRTLEYVRRAGVCEDIENSIRRSRQGRPRALSVEVILTAAILSFNEKRGTLLHTAIHSLLVNDLPHPVQREHNIIDAKGKPVKIRQVRYLWNRIASCFDTSPTYAPNLTTPQRTRRTVALQCFSDGLLSSASLHLPQLNRWAIDATAIDSASVGRNSNAAADAAIAEGSRPRSWDADARNGYRTQTWENRTEKVFGYQLTALTRLTTQGSGTQPLLTERMIITTGENAAPVDQLIDLFDRMQNQGQPVAEAIVDRGFSFKSAENWASPLRERGISQILDMHPNDRRVVADVEDGYIFIDGAPHCPSTPDHLKRIDRPATFVPQKPPATAGPEEVAAYEASIESLNTFTDLIAERAQYRFESHGKTAKGSPRYICPARAGKIRCTACPLSELFPDDLPAVEPADANNLPKACSQRTITISNDIEPKLRQRLYWGSPEWIETYAERNRVEQSFGLLKTPATGGVRRGFIHQVGKAKTTLALIVAQAASNLSRLLSWAKVTGFTDDPLVNIDVTNYGWVQLNADGTINPEDMPPPRVDPPPEPQT